MKTKGLAKKIAVLAAFLPLSANAAYLDKKIFTTVKGDIVWVCFEDAKKSYKGDTFLHYYKEHSVWTKYKLENKGGWFKRELLEAITEEDVPMYKEGLYSLYFDPDHDEENLVATFDINVSSKDKKEWIEDAKAYILCLNSGEKVFEDKKYKEK